MSEIITNAEPGTKGRRVVPEDIWALARDAYLGGESGPSAAARHGISLTSFRRRAAEEGWRRTDRPVDPLAPFDPEGPMLAEADQLALIDRRICWAIELGDVSTALRWTRMRDRFETREARRSDEATRAQRAADKRAHVDVLELTRAARDVDRIARTRLASVETELRLKRLRTKGRAIAASDADSARTKDWDSRDSKNSATATSSSLDPEAPGLSRAERRRRLKYAAKHGRPHPD